MSRLYTIVKSDRRHTNATAGANYETETAIAWGNAHNSEIAIHVQVIWGEDDTTPHVGVTLGKNVDYVVYDEGDRRIAERTQ